MTTVIVLNKAQMGNGNEELGRKILKTFLQKAATLSGLEALLLFNAGVLLATKDSCVATELTLLRERGIDILVCGTCVDFYGTRGQFLFEQPSNMDTIMAAMNKADKVITL